MKPAAARMMAAWSWSWRGVGLLGLTCLCFALCACARQADWQRSCSLQAKLVPTTNFHQKLLPAAQPTLHCYEISLPAETAAPVRIASQGVDLYVRVLQADGRLVTEIPVLEDEPVSLSLLALPTASLHLELRPAVYETAAMGNYEIVLGQPQGVTEPLRQAAHCGRTLAAGQMALVGQTATGLLTALSLLAQASACYAQANDPTNAARAHWLRAQAWRRLGKLPDAQRELEQAQAACNAALYNDDPKGEQAALAQRILAALSLVVGYRGETKTALAAGEQALRQSQKRGDLCGQAQANAALSEAYYFSDRPDKQKYEMAYAEAALQAWEKCGNRRGQAEQLTILADLWFSRNQSGPEQSQLSDAAKGERALGAARQLWQAVTDQHGLGLTDHIEANWQARFGHHQYAAELYQRAAQRFAATGDQYWQAAALQGLAYIYERLGDYALARQSIEQSLPIWKNLPDEIQHTATLAYQGWLQHLQGADAQALAQFDQLLAQPALAVITRIYTQTYRGTVLCKQNQLAQAQQAFATAQTLSRQQPNTITRQTVSLAQAQCLAQQRQFGAAQRLLRQLDRQLPPVNDVKLQLQSAYQQAEIAVAQGRLTEAQQTLAGIWQTVEKLRADVTSYDLRASYFATVQQYYALQIALLMQRGLAQPHQPALLAEAFETSERARARSLLDLLAQPPQSSPSVDSAARAFTQPARLAEVQQQLDAATHLWVFALGSPHSYLWVISATDIGGYRLAPRTQIEAAAARLRHLLEPARRHGAVVVTPASEILPAARDLRSLLWPPGLSLPAQRLLIIADGALQAVPFGVLPLPGTADEPLAQHLQIALLPSATALVQLRQRQLQRTSPPKPLLALIDPVYELADSRIQPQRWEWFWPGHADKTTTLPAPQQPAQLARLPATQREEAILRRLIPDALIYRGTEANRQQLLATELAQFRLLHFATHAQVDSTVPHVSGLVLSLFDHHRQPRADAWLRLPEIYQLRLAADLVMLSACATAHGKSQQGEGVLSLARGFLVAGATRVLATQWEVEDAFAGAFAEQFYFFLLREQQPPARALQSAQHVLRQNPRYQSPHYWASFALYGD